MSDSHYFAISTSDDYIKWSELQVVVAEDREAAVYIVCDSLPNGINAKYTIYDFVANEGFDMYDPHFAEYDTSKEDWIFY